MTMMTLGVERQALIKEHAPSWGRCGLLCNQASLDKDLVHSIHRLKDLLGSQFVQIFSPQHGLEPVMQDNMIETPHMIHGSTGLKIFSLYSETREPTKQMLDGIETILVDLQIVGCRVYTFKWTIAACLRAAKEHGKKVVIFDRPNPLGGCVIEGRVLESDRHSFVGEAPIPMRHGLTVGEMALFLNDQIKATLEVIPMESWDPSKMWCDLGRPWVLTSPNLPTFDGVALYPGMVQLEGTNLSEGRGTTLPFQQIGAPYIKDPETLVTDLKARDQIEGCYLRPGYFQPTSQKWEGVTCGGFHGVVLDPYKIRSYRLAINLLQYVMRSYPSGFQWKEPPYEYDYKTLPIELIIGSKDCVSAIQEKDLNDSYWTEGLPLFRKKISSHLLYDRSMTIG